MRKLILSVAFFCFSSLALADQNDPRLPGLFDALLNAKSVEEAAAIERQIWEAWTNYSDSAINQLMVNAGNAMGRGDFSSAERSLDQAVALAPDYAEAWNRRATLYYLQGRYEESLADIEKVMALEPRHFGALSGRGLCYLKLEEPEKAAEAFKGVLAINPEADGAKESLEQLRDVLGNDI